MSFEPVNWTDKAADWLWMIGVAFVAATVGLVRRVFTHEARLKALEKHQDERTKQLEALDRKLDTQTTALMERIDAQAQETRADIRMITGELIKKVPGS